MRNYVGDIEFSIDLVYESSCDRHDNQLYLITNTFGYEDDNEGCVTYSGIQAQQDQVYMWVTLNELITYL